MIPKDLKNIYWKHASLLNKAFTRKPKTTYDLFVADEDTSKATFSCLRARKIYEGLVITF